MAEENAPERYPKRIRKPVVKEFSNTTYRSQKRWTQQEKELLHSALRKYGDHDLALLATKVGTKSPVNIYNYLLMHKQAAAEDYTPGKTERLERLHSWLEHIRSKKQKHVVPEPAALSMLMIALLEDHPVATDGEVNFSEVYRYMFELLSGRHTVRWEEHGGITPPTLQFIKLSTLKLLKTAMKQMNHFQTNLAESSNNPNLFTEQNLSHLPAPVRRLVLHKHLNPLRLNEEATYSDILLGHDVEPLNALNTETNTEPVILDSCS